MTKCLVCHHDLVGRGKGYCRHCNNKKKASKRKASAFSRHAGHSKCQRIRISSIAHTTTSTGASRTAAPFPPTPAPQPPQPPQPPQLPQPPAPPVPPVPQTPNNMQHPPNATPQTEAAPCCCDNCQYIFDQVLGEDLLNSCQRTQQEKDYCNTRAQKVSLWHNARLKTALQPWMWKVEGGKLVRQLCSKCIRLKFVKGSKWSQRFAKVCKTKYGAIKVTKEAIDGDRTFDIERILLPFDAGTMSKRKWLRDLESVAALVTVLTFQKIGKKKSARKIQLSKKYFIFKNVFVRV